MQLPTEGPEREHPEVEHAETSVVGNEIHRDNRPYTSQIRPLEERKSRIEQVAQDSGVVNMDFSDLHGMDRSKLLDQRGAHWGNAVLIEDYANRLKADSVVQAAIQQASGGHSRAAFNPTWVSELPLRFRQPDFTRRHNGVEHGKHTLTGLFVDLTDCEVDNHGRIRAPDEAFRSEERARLEYWMDLAESERKDDETRKEDDLVNERCQL